MSMSEKPVFKGPVAGPRIIKNTRAIHVKISSKDYQTILNKAQRYGITISAFIRIATLGIDWGEPLKVPKKYYYPDYITDAKYMHVRVMPDEYQYIKTTAYRNCLTLSAYIRYIGLHSELQVVLKSDAI